MTTQNQQHTDWPLRWLPLAWFSLAFAAIVPGMIGIVTQGSPMAWLIERIGVSSPGTAGMILHEAGLLLAVLVLFAGLRTYGDPFEMLGLRGGLSRKMVVYAVGGALAVFLIWPILEWGIEAVGIPMLWWEEDLALNNLTDFIWLVIAAGFLSPVLEEILFRGYMLNALLARLSNRIAAILLATIAFTSIHIMFGPGTMIAIFFWTFVPSWLAMHFKSLYPAILMHILNNLLAYIVVPLVGWG